MIGWGVATFGLAAAFGHATFLGTPGTREEAPA